MWVDDNVNAIRSITTARGFAENIEAIVVESSEEAEGVAEDWAPSLLVLDVVGRDGSSLVRSAGGGRLTGLPWLLVSDEARHERVPGGVRAVCVSAHILRCEPPRIAALLLRTILEFRERLPAPMRPFLGLTVHEARRRLELARVEAASAVKAGPSSRRLEDSLSGIGEILDWIALQ